MKRSPSDDDNNDSSVVVIKPIEYNFNSSNRNTFQQVCKYFYGRYIGNKLLTFEAAPPEARGQLKHLLNNKFRKYNGDISIIPDGEHKVFDVMNHLQHIYFPCKMVL